MFSQGNKKCLYHYLAKGLNMGQNSSIYLKKCCSLVVLTNIRREITFYYFFYLTSLQLLAADNVHIWANL